jgi:hypothetical protein
MPGPIVFISHNRVKPGRLEDVHGLSRSVFSRIETEKPATAAFLGYLTADETEVSFIHVFADADAFARHLEGSDERSAAAYEFIEPLAIEIYGDAGDSQLGIFRQMAEAGIPLTIQPGHLGGFLRLSTG